MTLIAPRRKRSTSTQRPKVAVLALEDGCPKAHVEIGGRPVLWHAMMQFASRDLNGFAVALDGESGFSGLKVDHVGTIEVTAGARLLALRKHLGRGTFFVVSGSNVSDVDFDELLAFHRAHGRLATVVAVRPEARFGRLEMDGNQVVEFLEKPAFEQGWKGVDLTVLEDAAFDYITAADGWPTILGRLAEDGQLMAYKHYAFWGSVETMRDRQELEDLWQSGHAPWKTWQ
jgi:glucose-1-phosphate cytidylyltransferase